MFLLYYISAFNVIL